MISRSIDREAMIGRFKEELSEEIIYGTQEQQR